MLLAFALMCLFFVNAEATDYTHWQLISTDTLTGTAACTLYTSDFAWFKDSTYWQLGFSTNQANDSVDLAINAYWGVDSAAGPWTDAQAVAANHQIDDYIMTPYSAEAISKWFEWCKIIITGVTDKNGDNTIIKTYIGYRKYWKEE
jgi:hypothetical protein